MKVSKNLVLEILSESNKPLKAKEIAREIDGADTTAVNRCLYHNLKTFTKLVGDVWVIKTEDEIETKAKTAKKTSKAKTDKLEIDLLSILRKAYRKENMCFRPGQEETITRLLKGEKIINIQCTGYGKSLVYYFTAKILRDRGAGPILIISPLLALMKDQEDKGNDANKLGLTVVGINSDTKDEWDSTYKKIRKNKVDAILIAPEKLDNARFLAEMEDVIPKVSMFVIDEAHCIADWGHDFRPDYMRILGFIKKLKKGTPILATTATANDRVIKDIKEQIGDDAIVQRGTMERKNFILDIINIGSDASKLTWLYNNLPKLYAKNPGIVYCLTRKACKSITEKLKEHNINAEMYHAQIDRNEKDEIAKRFKNKEIDVLVATIAYGMGVNNKEIGFVVHYHKPANFVDYYQQIGRAGRNAEVIKDAYAIMLKGFDDDKINRLFINYAYPEEEDMRKVLRFIEKHPKQNLKTISSKILWYQNGKEEHDKEKVRHILSLLSVDGAIEKNSRLQYTRTDKYWRYNKEEIKRRREQRLDELAEFNKFVASKRCYMMQARAALGDIDAKKCEKCSNCKKQHFFE